MPTKTAEGWKIDIRPNGRTGRRYRKTFRTRAEAMAYKAHIIAEHKDRKPWEHQKADTRRLSDIADDWFKYHGHTLNTGEKRLQILKATARDLGNPVASKIDPADFIAYRQRRQASGITDNHLNHELTYLKAAFNELIRVDNWQGENPYGKLKKLKLDERELSFLTSEEIPRLLAALSEGRNPDALTIAKICLSIGCRWGEAQELRGEQIHHGKIHLTKTKTGRNRSVPISAELEAEIFDGRKKRGPLFCTAWEAFEQALKRADIETPRGQKTHILRHTFASHYMMNGGDLLTLNKILGHKTIQMTMAYSHLAPDHLSTAVDLNPLSKNVHKLSTK